MNDKSMTQFLDRCVWTATTGGGGSGDFTFGAVVTGYLSPTDAGVVDQQTYNYVVQINDLSQWAFVSDGLWDQASQTVSGGTVVNGSDGPGVMPTFTASPRLYFGCPLIDSLPAELFAEAISDGRQDLVTTSGLDYGYQAFSVITNTEVINVAAGTITLTNNRNNFVEWNPIDGVTFNSFGSLGGHFSAHTVPLAIVVTSGGTITSVTDARTPFTLNPNIDTLEQFAYDPLSSSGLDWYYTRGVIRLTGNFLDISSGFITLPDDTTCYVGVDPNEVNVTGLLTAIDISAPTPAGFLPLYQVNTSGGLIGFYIDLRSLHYTAFAPFSLMITDGVQNDTTTTGLDYGYNAFNINTTAAYFQVAASTITLTDNADNFVEWDAINGVTANTTAFTAARFPMATVTTLSGAITTVVDARTPYFLP